MHIASRLVGIARKMAQQSEHRAANLEREILDVEAQLQGKQTALGIVRLASKRARDYVPSIGPHFYCPACWIEKEQ